MTDIAMLMTFRGRKCFRYCGDQRCRCERNPRFASRIEARSDATGTGAAEGESLIGEAETPNPLSHAEAKQPALSTGPTPANCPIIADGSPTPSGVGPTELNGAE